MKLHYAAALALVGWYLLAPPVQEGSDGSGKTFYWANDKAPLPEWRQIGSYDAAQACDAAKWKHLADTARTTDTKSDYQSAFVLSDSAAQCIATDDPRLKEK
jgi:hypothetical protein